MKRFHRMMIGLYLGPFIISFIIVLFILLMQFVWLYVDDLMGKGLEGHVILELMCYAAASFVPLALPLAVLVSSIMTLGGLGERSELVPLRSSGMHLVRILFPLFLFVGVLAIGSFVFSNNVMPIANLKFKSLLWDIRNKKPALNIKAGAFYEGVDGVRILVGAKNDDTGELSDILIYDHRGKERGNHTVISAQSGRMKSSEDKTRLILELENSRLYDQRPPATGGGSNLPMLKGSAIKETVTIDLSGLDMARTDEELFSEHHEMLRMVELVALSDSLTRRLEARQETLRAHMSREFHPTRMRQSVEVADSAKSASMINQADQAPSSEGALVKPMDESLVTPVYELAFNLARNNRNFLERSLQEKKERLHHIAKVRVEWHRKLMLAFACVIFFFIGAPLGSIIRKGGLGAPTVFAIVFFLVFHISSFSAERLVVDGKMEPWPGMWISSLILIPIGIYLTYQAATDSPLLDLDSYARFWDKFKRRKQSMSPS